MYTCRSNCEKVFDTVSNRNRHEKLNCKRGKLDTMEVKEKVFKCGNYWCGKVFTKNFNLSRHVQNCHQKLKKNFSCTRCSKSFFKESKLRRHMKS